MMGKILKVRDHQNLAQIANSIREWMGDIKRQLDMMAGELKLVGDEMASQQMDPSSAGDYMIQFFEGST